MSDCPCIKHTVLTPGSSQRRYATQSHVEWYNGRRSGFFLSGFGRHVSGDSPQTHAAWWQQWRQYDAFHSAMWGPLLPVGLPARWRCFLTALWSNFTGNTSLRCYFSFWGCNKVSYLPWLTSAGRILWWYKRMLIGQKRRTSHIHAPRQKKGRETKNIQIILHFKGTVPHRHLFWVEIAKLRGMPRNVSGYQP